MKAKLTAIALTTLVAVNSAYAGGSQEVVLTSEVKWEQLNPARGDKSPQAGTLWGDRKGTVPTGFLAKVTVHGLEAYLQVCSQVSRLFDRNIAL